MNDTAEATHLEQITAALKWTVIAITERPDREQEPDGKPWIASHFHVTVEHKTDTRRKPFRFYYSMGCGNAERWLREKKGRTTYHTRTAYDSRECVATALRMGFKPTDKDIALQLCHCAEDGAPECHRDFEEWADSFGYDKDSRSAEKTFNLCRQQWADLQKLFPQPYEWWAAAREEIDQ